MTDADERAWSAWRSAVVDAVATLPDGGSLTLTAASENARPVVVRPPRLGGLVPARHHSAAPWVRLTRDEDHLVGHCVGASTSLGSFPFSPEEEAALLDLGWRRESSGKAHGHVRFWPDDVPSGPFLPRDEAERAATMVARTFREVLLCEAPAGPPTVTHD